MRRRQLMQGTALFAAGALARGAPAVPALTPPAAGAIPVAFVLSEGAVVIDFCGPWEVFQDTGTRRGDPAFSLYTVAETRRPLRASAGLQLVPDFDFGSAPAPKVIVIPAQRSSPAAIDWVRRASAATDMTMSVCTGAFLLAATGLLDGKGATTHHDSFDRFASAYPAVRLDRGARFVDSGKVATAGGLTSGIDLALHVVERYYGRAAAQETADYMEYQGRGWQTARR